MANKEPGYVYILTNPSFREDWVKIGKSSRLEKQVVISSQFVMSIGTIPKCLKSVRFGKSPTRVPIY